MRRDETHPAEPFGQSAAAYDQIYRSKPYADEAQVLLALAAERKVEGREWIDLACGSGRHHEFLTRHFTVTGADRSAPMLDTAKARNPRGSYVCGDMTDVEVPGKTFDVVSCLFGSIAYTRTVAALEATIANFARLRAKRGIVIVEPWISPARFVAGTAHARFVDEPGTKVARMNVNRIVDGCAVLEFHTLSAETGSDVRYSVEHHEVGLFSDADYVRAFRHAGLAAQFVVADLFPNGLYVATKRP